MVLNALSCIDVAIWTRLITKPAMKPMINSGADNQKAAMSA
jgi:hypothetical protein